MTASTDTPSTPGATSGQVDALLVLSFGGPEGQDDVIPFLRNVTAGRGIPDERLEEVAHHYRHFGGVSPINDHNRELKAALDDRRSRLLADRDAARAELTRWTGDPAASTQGEPPRAGLDPTRLRAGLEDLPALRAYAAERRRADAELDLARAGRRPDWSVEASYQRRDPRFGDMVSVGASVSLPLFQRERQESLIAARAADALRVSSERDATRRRLEADLRRALARQATDQDLWIRARDVVLPAVVQQSDLETAAYAAGRIGIGAHGIRLYLRDRCDGAACVEQFEELLPEIRRLTQQTIERWTASPRRDEHVSVRKTIEGIHHTVENLQHLRECVRHSE